MFDLYATHCLHQGEGREEARQRFGSSLLAAFSCSILNLTTFFCFVLIEARMLDRDHYLTAEGAMREGIIDKIITKRSMLHLS